MTQEEILTRARALPVYAQKEKILSALRENQVIVVQSPTGSGKTTQLPIILYEAGFCDLGMVGITQPRRIATLSVSDFIARQLGTTCPGIVGYKMRFEDKTCPSTKIKILTDGMLLQEMKLDPWLSKYSVLMVDEAHERSLNIDFVLGLLKRALKERPDLKVVVSSATINAEFFSQYFGGCPVVSIDTKVFPVSVIYDPPAVQGYSLSAQESMVRKVREIVERILKGAQGGDILIFMPGEKMIVATQTALQKGGLGRRLHVVPLYGRLSEEEQERVFDPAPDGKTKVVVSTNIAETSVTIDGITSVIDSGLAKLNFYSPRTFTSSLDETLVSRASCQQRKGRAGRTCAGTCYRLYSRSDFETRPEYTVEEILRTDLSEVVLQMADLGISDFEKFDFISSPGRDGIRGAVDTLNLLGALEADHSLSKIGKMMVRFPLSPRESRIIVESIMSRPNVLDDVLIAAAFLSTNSPFLLPKGEETDARRAQQEFEHPRGDFAAYLRLFRRFVNSTSGESFCDRFYLDFRVMSEIVSIKNQLAEICGELGVPILSDGNIDDYLYCVATGLIQFVCVKDRGEFYRSVKADKIQIHPGSSLFRKNPQFIVAGELIRTSRMFASSVSPLTEQILSRLNVDFSAKHSRARAERQKAALDEIALAGERFEVKKISGRQTAIFEWKKFSKIKSRLSQDEVERAMEEFRHLRALVKVNADGREREILAGEKFALALKALCFLDFAPINEGDWPKRRNFVLPGDFAALVKSLDFALKVAPIGKKGELGFLCLLSNDGVFHFKATRGFSTAVNETTASLEDLISRLSDDCDEESKAKINAVYSILDGFYR